jgi:hypothetical protein
LTFKIAHSRNISGIYSLENLTAEKIKCSQKKIHFRKNCLEEVHSEFPLEVFSGKGKGKNQKNFPRKSPIRINSLGKREFPQKTFIGKSITKKFPLEQNPIEKKW